MRRQWIFLALLLSLGVNCGLIGMGIARHRMEVQRERDSRPPGREGARFADRLALAGEARESFLRLQRELGERVHAGRRQIDEARRDLRRELISPQPDRERVEALLGDLTRAQDALDRAFVANILAAREVLDGRAEREYLRFVERFGAAVAGPRPPGPPPDRLRQRPAARRLQGYARPDGPPAGEPGPAPDGEPDRQDERP